MKLRLSAAVVATTALWSIRSFADANVAQATPTAQPPAPPTPAGTPPVAPAPGAPPEATQVPAANAPPGANPTAPAAPAPEPTPVAPAPPKVAMEPPLGEPVPSLPTPPPPPGFDPTVHNHDGLFVRLAGGLGFGSDAISSHLVSSASFHGFATQGEISVGGTPAPGLVIGGGIEGATIYTSTTVNGHSVSGGPKQLAVFALGPMLDWYLNPHRGFHLTAFLGLASLSADSSTGDRDPTGVAFSLGVGNEWWVGEQWSIGVLARFLYVGAAYDTSGIDEKHSVVTPAALFTVTYH